MKKQVNAVIDEVKSILGISYDISVPVATQLNDADIKTIQDAIYSGLAAGEIEYKGDTSNAKTLRVYANGLVTNHLRKCKQLNGNVKYEASGTGPKRDERLRELGKILASGQYEKGTEEFEAIEEAIVFRKNELAQSKGKAKVKISEIDMSVLPIGLQDIVNNASVSMKD